MVIIILTICPLVKNSYTRNDPGERVHLIIDEDSGIDETRNSFPDSNLIRKITNLLNNALPTSKKNSSCSDITVPKDFLKKT